jgi:hypothetical protein
LCSILFNLHILLGKVAQYPEIGTGSEQRRIRETIICFGSRTGNFGVINIQLKKKLSWRLSGTEKLESSLSELQGDSGFEQRKRLR